MLQMYFEKWPVLKVLANIIKEYLSDYQVLYQVHLNVFKHKY